MRIRNFGLSVLMILIFASLSFAQVDIEGPNHNTLSPVGSIAQAGATSSAGASASSGVINNIGNGFGNFSPHSSAIQGQIMGQDQFGYVAPVQTVSFKSPTQLLGINVPGMAELNFGNGQLKDVTNEFPTFDSGIGRLNLARDVIVREVSYCANERFKAFYETILDELKAAAKEYKGVVKNLRYQIMKAEAQKTVTGGFNGSGVGSALSPVGTTGGGGGGVTGISVGGTKAQPLFTIVIVEVKPA